MKHGSTVERQRLGLRWLSLALIVEVSVGWIVPLWFGVETVLSYLSMEVEPRLHGRTTGNSFPFVAFARSCLQMAFAWLAIVAVAWAAVGASRLLPRHV